MRGLGSPSMRQAAITEQSINAGNMTAATI
jgi:hypothetical protein